MQSQNGKVFLALNTLTFTTLIRFAASVYAIIISNFLLNGQEDMKRARVPILLRYINEEKNYRWGQK